MDKEALKLLNDLEKRVNTLKEKLEVIEWVLKNALDTLPCHCKG